MKDELLAAIEYWGKYPTKVKYIAANSQTIDELYNACCLRTHLGDLFLGNFQIVTKETVEDNTLRGYIKHTHWVEIDLPV